MPTVSSATTNGPVPMTSVALPGAKKSASPSRVASDRMPAPLALVAWRKPGEGAENVKVTVSSSTTVELT